MTGARWTVGSPRLAAARPTAQVGLNPDSALEFSKSKEKTRAQNTVDSCEGQRDKEVVNGNRRRTSGVAVSQSGPSLVLHDTVVLSHSWA